MWGPVTEFRSSARAGNSCPLSCQLQSFSPSSLLQPLPPPGTGAGTQHPTYAKHAWGTPAVHMGLSATVVLSRTHSVQVTAHPAESSCAPLGRHESSSEGWHVHLSSSPCPASSRPPVLSAGTAEKAQPQDCMFETAGVSTRSHGKCPQVKFTEAEPGRWVLDDTESSACRRYEGTSA